MLQKIIPKITNFTNITSKCKYNFIPPSSYEIQKKPNPIIKLNLAMNNDTFAILRIRLFENVVPKTVENYKQLLLGIGRYKQRNLSLIGTNIQRIIPRAFIEFSAIKGEDCSIYGNTFRDQSFQLMHDRPGLVSSISDENTNSSRFLITISPCPFLDYKNIVFGQLTQDSLSKLRKMQKLKEKINKLEIFDTQLEQQFEQLEQ